MTHTDTALPVGDMKMTVEGLLPHDTGILRTVYIITLALTCVLFPAVLLVFM